MTLKSLNYLVNTERNEIKDVLLRVEERIVPGDIIIVDNWSSRPYRFYHQKYHLPEPILAFNKIAKNISYTEMKQAASLGDRVWIIMTWWEEDRTAESFIPDYFKKEGTLKYEIHSAYAAGFLYDFED